MNLNFSLSVIIYKSVVFAFFIFLMACQGKQEKASQVVDDSSEKDKINLITDQQQNSAAKKLIIFFGNSLTAGYGLDEQEAFPALIQSRIDSLGLPYTVMNAGLSGETSSGGDNRISWVLNQSPDIFILELGANDMLRGLELKETEKNLRNILNKVKEKNPDVKLVISGMQAPPNLGQDYTRKFGAIFPLMAKEFNASLIPFLLENVAAVPELNLSDGKHPNEKGQKIVMENVWKVLEPLLH